MKTVDSWGNLDLENHLFCNLTGEINQLIAPLITYFDLDTFNYFKTYTDNSQIRLSNNKDWAIHYLTNRLYQQSIFELPAHNYSKNRFIWSNIDSHNLILREASKFGINHGITLIEPTHDGCEFFFLGTTIRNKNVINKYLSNFYLLEKFIANFHNSGKDLFTRIEPYRVMAKDWHNNMLQFNSADHINKFTFLASIYGYKFTKRELECVPLLLKGLSAKQIAEYLKISFRTVEAYINNLKQKTNTLTKNDLIFLLSTQFN